MNREAAAPSARDQLYHAARTDFMTFMTLAFGVLHPGVPFEDNWHLHAIAQRLSDAMTSQSVRDIISMPPRCLKSEMISVAFVAFLMGHDPATRIICVTYVEKLSADMSGATARLMRSEMYRRVFPRTRLASETKLKLETTAGGWRMATSVGGPTTGFGGDWVIVDDPMNATDADSQAARETVKTYFDRALSSRVNDETRARFIVVMQRLHADDLAGHLLDKGGWNSLRLQAIAAEPAEVDVGKREMYEVKVGDLLHPARLPREVLDRKRRDMGSRNFQAQYQQDPTPSDGNIVRREWLRYYTGAPPLDGARIVMSLDTATKTDPTHDYSVCTIWSNLPGRHVLIDVWRDKVEYPGLRQKLIELYNQHRPDILLVEDENNGRSLIQELRPMGIRVIGRSATQTKLSRLVAATSFIETGQMLLPAEAPWLAAFEFELLGFPGARHDDQVDSISQYFAWVRERGEEQFIVHNLHDSGDPSPETLRDVLASLPRY